jgi:hypothetical protein
MTKRKGKLQEWRLKRKLKADVVAEVVELADQALVVVPDKDVAAQVVVAEDQVVAEGNFLIS